MNYRIRFRDRAEQALSEIWRTAANRGAVTRASDRLERLLSHDPMGHGESRSGRRRVVFVDPLVAFYTVNMSKRLVIVTDIRLM
jgi:plasmid stabilization system protein ParE